MNNKLFVCYFGFYRPDYARNAVLISGLRANGVEVVECNVAESEKWRRCKLFWKYLKIGRKCDAMVVGFSGHTLMPLAWALTRLPRKKLVFDAFVSWYDSNILDRKKYPKRSFMALKYWIIDWAACRLADVVLLDADEHCKYFESEFSLKKEKLKTLLIGCPDDIMYPMKRQKNTVDFLVHFHGTYIPIQGIPFIIEAAGLLRDFDISFNVIGKLSTYKESLDLANKLGLQKVNFINYMPYEQLAEHIAMADICLGMFGTPPKAMRCGAFKVTEALAMAKPVITGRTPAMEEFLIDKENVLFCKMGDSRDLADKILELRDNQILREKIAAGGYKTYLEKLTPKVLGAELLRIINQISL